MIDKLSKAVNALGKRISTSLSVDVILRQSYVKLSTYA